MRTIFCFLIFWCLSGPKSFGQSRAIDSLRTVLKTSGEDSFKVNTLIDLGSRLRTARQYNEAMDNIGEAIKLAERIKFPKGKARGYFNLGLVYRAQNQYKQALDNYFIALKIYEDISMMHLTGGLHNEIASIYHSQGKYTQSLHHTLEGLKYMEMAGNADGAAFLQRNAGLLLRKKGRFEEAIPYFLSAIKHWEKTWEKLQQPFDLMRLCENYNSIAHIYLDKEDYATAAKYLNLAMDYAQKSRSAFLQIVVYRGQAIADRLQGDYANAIKNQFEALKIAEKTNNDAMIAEIYSELGTIYLLKEDTQQAMNYARKALDMVSKVPDKVPQINLYSNMAAVLSSEKQYDLAMHYQNEAKKIAVTVEDKSAIFLVLHNMGLLYYKKATDTTILRKDSIGNFLSLALDYQQQALKLPEESASPTQYIHCYLAIGNILSRQALLTPKNKNTEKEALTYLQKAMKLAETYKAKELMKQVAVSLAELYSRQKDYKKAYDYAMIYTSVKDSLINSTAAKKIEAIRLSYEIQKVQNDEKLKQEQQKSDLTKAFEKREDSIRFQQKLTNMQLTQQTLLMKQQQQELKLKQQSLDLLNQQYEINQLAFLKSEAELLAEQSKSKEKEKQLTIAEQEKALQASKLQLNETELNLKENQLLAQRRQQIVYWAAIFFIVVLSGFIFWHLKNLHRTNAAIAAEKLKATKAEAAHRAAELELQSLRAQLNPHFMFNSLNAIQELILKEDIDNSHLYLSRFSELLRLLLNNANEPFIPLSKELQLLDQYLSLEKLRIKDLEYTIHVDDTINTNKISIPNMMIQPYLENAIWHGLSHKNGRKQLSLSVKSDNTNLMIEVKDNGIGREKAGEMKSLYRRTHQSKGMELLSKRFQLLSKEFGSAIDTNVVDLYDNGEPAGTLVKITIPVSIIQKTQQPVLT
jgi:tetratricopeptide (TPR) repeat protein